MLFYQNFNSYRPVQYAKFQDLKTEEGNHISLAIASQSMFLAMD